MEGLWDQTQDVTCNRHFADLGQLEEALTAALRPFLGDARTMGLVPGAPLAPRPSKRYSLTHSTFC